jgi:hypothetical protein
LICLSVQNSVTEKVTVQDFGERGIFGNNSRWPRKILED